MRGSLLHDYVPFYFAPRSPMIYSIHKGYVQDYQEGQTQIVYLVVDAETLANSDIPFTFTDGHATMAYSDYYEDLEDIYNVIDWEVMESRYWADTEDDPNRKCKRQAEFLIYQCCPWEFIEEIGVINQFMKKYVESLLQVTDVKPLVRVYADWYY